MEVPYRRLPGGQKSFSLISVETELKVYILPVLHVERCWRAEELVNGRGNPERGRTVTFARDNLGDMLIDLEERRMLEGYVH